MLTALVHHRFRRSASFGEQQRYRVDDALVAASVETLAALAPWLADHGLKVPGGPGARGRRASLTGERRHLRARAAQTWDDLVAAWGPASSWIVHGDTVEQRQVPALFVTALAERTPTLAAVRPRTAPRAGPRPC